MKFIVISLILIIKSYLTCGQSSLEFRSKPSLDSTAIKNWVHIDQVSAFSSDGRYFAYSIESGLSNGNSLIIQSTISSWKKEFKNASMVCFSSNSKSFCIKFNDTLLFGNLGNGFTRYEIGVELIKQPTRTGEWIAFKHRNNSSELNLINLSTGEMHVFDDIKDCAFDKYGKVLMLLKSKSNKNGITRFYLQWLELPKLKMKTIWSKESKSTDDSYLNCFNIDQSSTQIAFVIKEKKNISDQGKLDADLPVSSLWYYKVGMDSAVKKLNDDSLHVNSQLLLSSIFPKFSNDGRYIYFRLQEFNGIKNNQSNNISVDIWNYKDTFLQSSQLKRRFEVKTYGAVMNVNNNRVIQLTTDNETIKALPQNGDFVVVNHDDSGDRFWLNETTTNNIITNWLVSLIDGSRKKINSIRLSAFYFSPDGKYLVYYDSEKDCNYFSYNLSTDSIVNISTLVPKFLLGYKDDYSISINNKEPIAPVSIGGWVGEDNLLVYDNYDIWQLDLKGKNNPQNITNGYGRLNRIKFRLTYGMNLSPDPVEFKKSEKLLLSAFNMDSKYNGFYYAGTGMSINPELLSMGPWTYFHCGPYTVALNGHEFDKGIKPIKAKNKNIWIVKRQSSTDAPNYFITKDFIKYSKLTDIQPHRKFNWLTAELVSWQQFDGTLSQGVLYKPEDFNPEKKYPVLFNYYEQLSHRLYEFPTPVFTGDNIDVAWFVSNGYLVFTPDIYFKDGEPGESVYNTVISAAEWLNHFSFVDKNRIGINGHSTGGFQTNYLITHSNLFSAAIEGAGTSDWVSSALQLSYLDGESRLGQHERNIGGTLWERKDSYLKNSPILDADKITTPLIIFHSKDDSGVPWEQAVELFVSLRRLNKPAWMLQYDGENHGNTDKAAEDFTIRITQFYDHYLKGAFPPKWMTQGIPARLKGLETGYELDSNGICGNNCKICIKLTLARKTKNGSIF